MLPFFILNWIFLILLILVSKNKIRTGLINLAIQIVYSSFLLYGLYFDSQGGTALTWELGLLMIVCAHTLINFFQFIYRVIKNNRNDYNTKFND